MPLYDLACDPCETIHEDVVSTVDERNSVPCPECGAHMRVYIQPVMTIGPMPSKPLDMEKQLGQVFHSNGELRQYKKENPNVTFYDRDDSVLRKKKDQAHERADRMAKKAGYGSIEHMRSEKRTEKKKRAGG